MNLTNLLPERISTWTLTEIHEAIRALRTSRKIPKRERKKGSNKTTPRSKAGNIKINPELATELLKAIREQEGETDA